MRSPAWSKPCRACPHFLCCLAQALVSLQRVMPCKMCTFLPLSLNCQMEKDPYMRKLRWCPCYIQCNDHYAKRDSFTLYVLLWELENLFRCRSAILWFGVCITQRNMWISGCNCAYICISFSASIVNYTSNPSDTLPRPISRRIWYKCHFHLRIYKENLSLFAYLHVDELLC